MIGTLNALVDLVEQRHDARVDVPAFARAHATTEYHLRRMFAALAGMPFSEYVRRRRMTLAAADLVRGERSLLAVAVRYGYGSVEAFTRAFRSVHAIAPADARRTGGPLTTQPVLRFRLSVEGSTPMDVTVTDRPAFLLVGHAVEVPLVHQGVNPHIAEHVASIAPEEHARLKVLGATEPVGEPAGILAVTLGPDPDAAEGSPLTYLHGVAVRDGAPVPSDLDAIPVDAGTWAVFGSSGPFPDTLQQTWAATATDWFPSNPWRLRPGPSIVRYLELTATRATCELWMPIEPA
ncbi:AraC family transcriptional regulator [Actinotalea fermentans]|uniref:AraC family transcriptional regulator n=1 Tax=Actinotalea fermentans TaxID=43671 RepID=A0A511YWQ4_9CELL|nr:GyrI-like domain-containing protein [Actinotalea fermentans]KGM16073.1 AraC family transcriptional regulator [Actinotalea fermentans ATCC 43279 = JCM 9966 = DSM 3133]GEN79644.1 AraC family transcriptional regulator [Actinotalea fermentans]